MNLNAVAAALTVLSAADGSNNDYNCSVCAVLAANALVTGQAPTNRASVIEASSAYNIDTKAAQCGAQKSLEIFPDHLPGAAHSRAYLVWTWLQRASRGVYLFEQDDDHVYNFVVDGGIYLIDSATQVFRKVDTSGDCSVETLAYPSGFPTKKKLPPMNTEYGFNYLNPQPLSDNDRLNVYRWGDLHQHWR